MQFSYHNLLTIRGYPPEEDFGFKLRFEQEEYRVRHANMPWMIHISRSGADERLIIAPSLYKDGKVERLIGTEIVPPSPGDPETGVGSKDVVIDPETGLSARLYKPKPTNPDQKLPLLVYFHGGAFIVQTAFAPMYQKFLNSVASEANAIVVSVDYRRAPEHPVPIGYYDSWAAVKWVVSHSGGNGEEEWLRDFVDFGRVFFGGDSAGASIAHNMAIRVG
ncbi:hypothetical protein Vadar_012805 [Vaccinium darrowii]|uniref:Uncharacterized protein n=1 Tax=Vaccinium darrowii TaxID=229202 RepID=A0ACB7X0Q0_9ERIC|nr:hypothetical protein Vadar_012805 [Vaccinium darrowii]